MSLVILISLVAMVYLGIREALEEKSSTNKQEPLVGLKWYNLYHSNNLFLVYVYFGLRMMRQDSGELRTQQTLFLRLLHKRFSTWTMKEVTHYYLNMLKSWGNADFYSLYSWMNSKSNDEEKLQLLDILTEIAYHNDVVTSGEFKLLYDVATRLKISQQTIRSIISQHQSRLEAKQSHKKELTTKKSTAQRLKQKLHILGLNYANSQNDIKKAYRAQAKMFHPDRFAKKSKSEQQMAHERFIEIQKAYDYLLGVFDQ